MQNCCILGRTIVNPDCSTPITEFAMFKNVSKVYAKGQKGSVASCWWQCLIVLSILETDWQLSHQPLPLWVSAAMGQRTFLLSTPGSNWSSATRMSNRLRTQVLHKEDIFNCTNPFGMIIMKGKKKRFGSNVTPRLVLQGHYNQLDNEMSFKSKMFSVTFKTLKAIPSIDYHWWRSFT